MPSHEPDSGALQKLDYDRVRQIAGAIEPWQVSAILALGATVGELEAAVAWITVEADHSGLHHAAEGDVGRDSRITAVHEILAADKDTDDDD